MTIELFGQTVATELQAGPASQPASQPAIDKAAKAEAKAAKAEAKAAKAEAKAAKEAKEMADALAAKATQKPIVWDEVGLNHMDEMPLVHARVIDAILLESAEGSIVLDYMDFAGRFMRNLPAERSNSIGPDATDKQCETGFRQRLDKLKKHLGQCQAKLPSVAIGRILDLLFNRGCRFFNDGRAVRETAKESPEIAQRNAERRAKLKK